METLAYLHLALAYDEPATLEPIAPRVRKFFAGFNGKTLSSSAWIRFLSVALTLAVLSVATNAVAYQRGQTSEAIRSIQQRLQQLGYFDGPLTGYYGEITEASVIRFQRENGLALTGRVDAETLTAIERLLRPVEGFGSISQVGYDSEVLSLGQTGIEVNVLQEQLQRLGYLKRPPTGQFDAETRNAVLRFQRDFGIQTTGMVGPTTRTALQQQLAGIPTGQPLQAFTPTTPKPGMLKLGDRGFAVKALQERLIVAGYPIGTADGSFGPATQAALKQFQASFGLEPDGVLGAATQEVLERKFYVVVIPKRNSFTLSAVREIFPDAFEAEHRLGSYIHAGSSVRRDVAQTRSKFLQQRGLTDVRVAYF